MQTETKAGWPILRAFAKGGLFAPPQTPPGTQVIARRTCAHVWETRAAKNISKSWRVFSPPQNGRRRTMFFALTTSEPPQKYQQKTPRFAKPPCKNTRKNAKKAPDNAGTFFSYKT
ncbi:MAG: hypothetical protein ABI286_02580 [Edaphobacter sp.]